MNRYILVSCLLLTFSSFAYAMTQEEVKIVSDSVLEICRGGSHKGEDSSIEIKGEGNAKVVVFKKLANLGLSGEATFSKKEWNGIKPLLPESFDSKAYVKCVMDLTPIFLNKFATSGPTPDPKVSFFRAEPSQIKEGGSSTLKWSVMDASSVVIDQGIGNVPLIGTRLVSPKKSTVYTLTTNSQNVIRQATAVVTVTPLSLEDKNSVGALPGDQISYFKVLSYSKDNLVAELSYHYNPQHGQVWIGGYLLDKNSRVISRGFFPTAANEAGKTSIKVGVDPSIGPVQSKWIFFWLYESNKGEGFVSKRFPYTHYWN